MVWYGMVLSRPFKVKLPSCTFKGRERTIPSIRPAFRTVSQATLEKRLKDNGEGGV